MKSYNLSNTTTSSTLAQAQDNRIFYPVPASSDKSLDRYKQEIGRIMKKRGIQSRRKSHQAITVLNDKNSQKKQKKNQDQQQQQKKPEKTSCCDILPKFLVFAIIVAAITYVALNLDTFKDYFEDYIEWLKNNPTEGFFIYILIEIVTTVCAIPGTILTLGAGYSYYIALNEDLVKTMFVACSAAYIGSVIGSSCAMLLGRYVFRDLVRKKAQKWKYFQAFEQAVKTEGFKIVFLLRLPPTTPYNIFNYFCGITSLKFRDYIFGSIGMIPQVVMYVYFGTLLKNISDIVNGNFDGGKTYKYAMIAGICVSALTIIYVIYVTKKYLNQIVQKQKQDQFNKQSPLDKQVVLIKQ